MNKIPSPFKFNALNAFCAFSLMLFWGVLFGIAGSFLGFAISLAFFPVMEEKK